MLRFARQAGVLCAVIQCLIIGYNKSALAKMPFTTNASCTVVAENIFVPKFSPKEDTTDTILGVIKILPAHIEILIPTWGQIIPNNNIGDQITAECIRHFGESVFKVFGSNQNAFDNGGSSPVVPVRIFDQDIIVSRYCDAACIRNNFLAFGICKKQVSAFQTRESVGGGLSRISGGTSDNPKPDSRTSQNNSEEKGADSSEGFNSVMVGSSPCPNCEEGGRIIVYGATGLFVIGSLMLWWAIRAMCRGL